MGGQTYMLSEVVKYYIFTGGGEPENEIHEAIFQNWTL